MIPFSPSLTIVIPAYNERDNLPRVVGDALAFARASCRACEVLVVDDGSSRRQRSVLQTLAAPELRIIRHARNAGLTAALRSGFFGAANDFVTWIPADGQIPLAELAKILDAWRDHDLVLSTYRRRGDGVVRAVMSRGLRLLLRVATGLRDRLEGVYLFRRALLDELDLVAAQLGRRHRLRDRGQGAPPRQAHRVDRDRVRPAAVGPLEGGQRAQRGPVVRRAVAHPPLLAQPWPPRRRPPGGP